MPSMYITVKVCEPALYASPMKIWILGFYCRCCTRRINESGGKYNVFQRHSFYVFGGDKVFRCLSQICGESTIKTRRRRRTNCPSLFPCLSFFLSRWQRMPLGDNHWPVQYTCFCRSINNEGARGMGGTEVHRRKIKRAPISRNRRVGN